MIAKVCDRKMYGNALTHLVVVIKEVEISLKWNLFFILFCFATPNLLLTIKFV